MHHMFQEILQQPAVVANLLERQQKAAREVARLVEARQITQVVLAARGTSDNAAVYGQYLFQIQNHLAAFLATPSVVTLYNSRPRLRSTMVIGISQSGRAQDVMEYMAAAREQGSPVVAITNNPQSGFGEHADIVVDLDAGQEHSVAATKTYTASLAALALISSCLCQCPDALRALFTVPELIARAVQETFGLAQVAAEAADESECFVIGRGLNYSTALETALKIMETSYARARAYSSADLLHGPVAAVQSVPCIVYAPRDAAQQAVLETAERLRELGTRMMVISSDPQALALADHPVHIPAGEMEFLDPLAQIVAGQRFAYHLAVARGLDPDHPRGLTKVTVTR